LVAEKMQKPKLTGLSEDQVQNIAKALADPRRYEIIKRISRSAQPLACESVRGCLEITAPTLSHHMKELEVAGLVTVRRSGKFIHYEFRRDVLESFLASLRRDCCQPGWTAKRLQMKPGQFDSPKQPLLTSS
jgi:ArsR family transcriptional regulator